ncbi:MAG: hypothetical protein AAGE84_03120 [Cyanobacteria bacterium P01_G01_bin.39]
MSCDIYISVIKLIAEDNSQTDKLASGFYKTLLLDRINLRREQYPESWLS